jgi:hypothetical protein
MDIRDRFVTELVSILNTTAIKRKSKNRFSAHMTSEDDGKDSLVYFYLNYESKEDEELHTFYKMMAVVTEEHTVENALDDFKEYLIEAIVFYKNYMSDYTQLRSMHTLLSKPKIEKKVFNKFDKYLEEENNYENEIQIESGRCWPSEEQGVPSFCD